MFYPKEREMVLGMFNNTRVLRAKYDWVSYGFGIQEDDEFPEDIGLEGVDIQYPDILQAVYLACDYYNTINFVLDGIKAPLDTWISVTCGELQLVISHPRFLDKTIFWLKEEKIPTEKVLKVLNGEVLFDNIDFSSISF